MDWIRQLLTAGAVIGLLAAALAWLRKRGLARAGSHPGGAARRRRLEVLDRVALTAQHSLHLIRVDGQVILVGRSPGGLARLGGAVERPGEGDTR
ncbi:MAG: flagellar biosynthetic protein FliO [Bryobacterales bacterium]|nr:flagellar biosynthetic protein FliO [Bryobacterales bacterium]